MSGNWYSLIGIENRSETSVANAKTSNEVATVTLTKESNEKKKVSGNESESEDSGDDDGAIDIQADYEDLITENQILRREKRDLQMKLQELANSQHQAGEQRASSQTEDEEAILGLTNQLKQLQNHSAEQASSLREAEKKISSLKDTLASIQIDYLELLPLKMKIQEMKRKADEAKVEIATLTKSLSQTSAQRDDLQLQLTAALTTLEKESKAEEALNVLQAQYTAALTTIDALRADIEEEKKRKERSELRVEELQGEISHLNRRCESLVKEVKRLVKVEDLEVGKEREGGREGGRDGRRDRDVWKHRGSLTTFETIDEEEEVNFPLEETANNKPKECHENNSKIEGRRERNRDGNKQEADDISIDESNLLLPHTRNSKLRGTELRRRGEGIRDVDEGDVVGSADCFFDIFYVFRTQNRNPKTSQFHRRGRTT